MSKSAILKERARLYKALKENKEKLKLFNHERIKQEFNFSLISDRELRYTFLDNEIELLGYLPLSYIATIKEFALDGKVCFVLDEMAIVLNIGNHSFRIRILFEKYVEKLKQYKFNVEEDVVEYLQKRIEVIEGFVKRDNENLLRHKNILDRFGVEVL